MKKAVIFGSLIVLLTILWSSMVRAESGGRKTGPIKGEFGSYYCRIDSGQSWEKFAKVGKYADVKVTLNDPAGELVFWRASSYLPYWKTSKGRWYVDEVVPRKGDGPAERPDKNNLYSFVRIIENNSDQIVVHWRYFPDFKLGSHCEPTGGNVGFDGVVHEYFTIRPDGTVTRTIRQGTKKLDDWNDPANRTTQKLKLTAKGITNLSTTRPKTSTSDIPPVKGSPVLEFEDLETEYENEEEDYDEYQNLRLAASFSFDDGLKSRPRKLRDKTLERISGKYYDIEGHKSVWKKGVSGTALGFDGYYSKVSIRQDKAVKINRDFALEAWVAPGAYSVSSWTAIVHQSKWKAIVADPYIFWNGNWGPIQLGEVLTEGYFIGIDEKGHVGFFIKMGRRVEKLISDEILELNKWSHVAVTFSDGTLRLFVNGKISDYRLSGERPDFADADFVIGMNDDSIGYVSQHVVRRFSTFPSRLGFDGLIDEVKLYTGSMFKEQAMALHDGYKPADRRADLKPRTLPGRPGIAKSFGASYTNLKYHDLWDNMWREGGHPDIIVKFDEQPTSVVFWRGCRSPGWVTDTNKWICDQSTELTDWHWDDRANGCQSCCEHMSDYQARHSHVRLIENTDARVLVHWRYASVDVLYKHPNTCRNKEGWGVWTDEYLMIYPDGVGVRKVDNYGSLDYYFDSKGGEIGFHDTQFLSEAGTRPEDNINLQALTVVSHKDKVTELNWSAEHPSGGYDGQIAWVNLKSDYKVFEIFPPGSKVNVWAGGEKTSYSKFSAWNHYPVTQAPCDGRFCVGPDRLAHSALGAVDNIVDTGGVLIYGFTNKNARSLIPLARSWNHAPKVINVNSAESLGYDKGQRAYVLKAKPEVTKISFSLDASAKSPVVNPCFVIKNWAGNSKAALKIDGKTIEPGKSLRQGVIKDTDGSTTLVVWLKKQSTSPMKIELSRASKNSASFQSSSGSDTGKIEITDIPDKLAVFAEAGFSKYVNVFGVHVFATLRTGDSKVLHAASVMAQYLDNDEDGEADNPLVLSNLVSRNAYLVMTADEDEFETLDHDAWHDAGFHCGQFLHAMETRPDFLNGGRINAPHGHYDASLEEVLHLITDHGYGNAYPAVFGRERGTAISDCLDAARGGYFAEVPTDGPHYGYPEGSWFHYDDETCDHDCMVSEYIYWALTSILGTQDYEGRFEEIGREWELNTEELVKSKDPTVYALLTNPEYKMPTKAPDGNYEPFAMVISEN